MRKLWTLRLVLVILCISVSLLWSSVARAAATFTLSLASGTVGTLVNVAVTRTAPTTYGPYTSFWLSWDSLASSIFDPVTNTFITPDNLLGQTRVLDDVTSFTMTFRVPETAKGTHNVILYDGANTYSQAFLVIPSFTIAPTAGGVGTQVSVSGTGFGSSEAGIAVNFVGYPSDISLKTVSADTKGSWTTSFTVPETARGTHIVAVSGPGTAVGEVRGVGFNVTPSITITPTTGGVGAEVSVSGTGFAINETGVAVTFDGAPVKTDISADAKGSWTTSFFVPEATRGSHVIGASGPSSAANEVPGVSFRVTPSITITPTAGGVGTEVSVSGTSFAISETGITVTFDGTPVKTGISADAKGTWHSSFIVPEATRGSHVVAVSVPGTAVGEVPGVSFRVTPSIAITPTAGGVGTEVSVNGTSFAISETGIAVTFDGTSVKTGISADAKGGWRTSFAVPEAARGSHVIAASSKSAPAGEVPNVSFRVTPKFAVSPTAGGVGTEVSVSGTGFAISETGIAITFDGTPVKIGISADGKGTWRTSFTVPEAARGSYVIAASSKGAAAGEVPNVSFALSPSVRTALASGHVGENVTVTGNGFAGNEKDIKVTLDSIVAKEDISADASGYWKTSITIPPSVRGNHNIGAYGSSTNAAEVTGATFAVTSRMVLNLSETHVGASVTVHGSGFSGNQTLTLKYDATTVLSGVTTASDGTFSVTFTVPRSIHGEHTIAASDKGGATGQATLMMEATPPPIPEVGSPTGHVGWFAAKTEVSFDWQDVTDPSGVFYTVEISTDADFVTVIVTRSGLAESRYKLSPEEALPQGNYYWRVKAADGAANDSAWTLPQPFQVGLTALLMVLWGIFAIVALVLFVVFSRRK